MLLGHACAFLYSFSFFSPHPQTVHFYGPTCLSILLHLCFSWLDETFFCFYPLFVFLHILPTSPTLTPLNPGSGRGWLSRGGAVSAPPPTKSMKEWRRTPSCYLEVGPLWKWSSYKKLGSNLRKWMRFVDLKIWQKWDFDSTHENSFTSLNF